MLDGSITIEAGATDHDIWPTVKAASIESDIPARLDRLPWSRWHVRILVALGTSWILDGLEVTLVGSLSGVLQSHDGLGLSNEAVTGAATTYLIGAVLGAMLFGYLTDRHGRKKLFLVTLSTYSVATLATGFSMDVTMFLACRFFTGLGIGGEYAAINSAVDELIPGKVRGTADLMVNATFWIGACIGSLAAFYLLRGQLLPAHLGWRAAFAVGGTLGFGVLLLRLAVPESPRWLMLRGREREAEAVMADIESKAAPKGLQNIRGADKLKIRTRDHTPLREIFGNMLGVNRNRSILGLVLMAGQAFFFNAIFFTFALVGKKYYGISDAELPLQLLPFAAGSFLGPVILGHFFDRWGRKPMIAATYGVAGALLLITSVLFAKDAIDFQAVRLCFSVVLFVASSAASAAYLTVSEIFPLEIRAFAIAIFYSIGTGIGGVLAPLLFGKLIDTSKVAVAYGYALGAVLMMAGALCEVFMGIEAAGQPLEAVSKPLQSAE